MTDSTRAEVASLRRLLLMARDLMQAPDVGSLVELVAPALQELLFAENSLVFVRLGGLEYSAAYGGDGLVRELREDGELYRCARRALEDQRLILRSDAHQDPARRGGGALTAGDSSLLTVPFPALQPVGVLGAQWGRAMSSQWLERRIPTTRRVAELLGAAIGNVELRLALEREVSATYRETDQAVQRHEVELQRRDLVEDEIRRLSITDVLTGMLNRRGFFLRAEQSLKVVRRKRLPSALLFSDIDGLKMVNDRLGHDEGDRLIQDGANILRNCFRDSDVVARIGGDEFAAFTLDTAEPEVILSRIQKETEHFNRHSSRPYEVSLSSGIVPCDPSSDSDLSDYLALADERMYAQKKGR